MYSRRAYDLWLTNQPQPNNEAPTSTIKMESMDGAYLGPQATEEGLEDEASDKADEREDTQSSTTTETTNTVSEQKPEESTGILCY